MYILEYPQWIKGRWIRRREYVPKPKVKALRQRIKRNKDKCRKEMEQNKAFIQEAYHIASHLQHKPINEALIKRVEKLVESPLAEPVTETERARIIQALVVLADAMLIN